MVDQGCDDGRFQASTQVVCTYEVCRGKRLKLRVEALSEALKDKSSKMRVGMVLDFMPKNSNIDGG